MLFPKHLGIIYILVSTTGAHRCKAMRPSRDRLVELQVITSDHNGIDNVISFVYCRCLFVLPRYLHRNIADSSRSISKRYEPRHGIRVDREDSIDSTSRPAAAAAAAARASSQDAMADPFLKGGRLIARRVTNGRIATAHGHRLCWCLPPTVWKGRWCRPLRLPLNPPLTRRSANGSVFYMVSCEIRV